MLSDALGGKMETTSPTSQMSLICLWIVAAFARFMASCVVSFATEGFADDDPPDCLATGVGGSSWQ